MIEPLNKTNFEPAAGSVQCDLDQPSVNEEGSTNVQSSTAYSVLGARIANWTSNFLATAVVVVIALAIGSQLVSTWNPKASPNQAASLVASQAWPALQACSLRFGDSPFQLNREVFNGSEKDLAGFLQTCCRHQLDSNAQPVGPIGPHESAMIADSNDQTPVDQVAGSWRIFHGPEIDGNNPLPMALGIRDDCTTSDSSSRSHASSKSRLVVWALAMPEGQNQWVIFVGTAATQNASTDLNYLLPDRSNRTLEMTDSHGGSIIGFSGGEFEKAIAFYTQEGRKRRWKRNPQFRQTENSWSGRFFPTQKSNGKTMQVHLTLDHQEKLTGILMLQPVDQPLEVSTANSIAHKMRDVNE